MTTGRTRVSHTMSVGTAMLALLALCSCEIQTTSGPPRAASPVAPPPPGAPQPSPQPPDPPGPQPPQVAPPVAPAQAGGIAPGKCPYGSVCFNVAPKAPGAISAMRFVLLWTAPGHQKGPSDVVQLAYLNGTERSVVLPLSAIKPPWAVMMGQAWGYVYAVTPSDPGTQPKSAVGVAKMMFVHAVGAQAQAQAMKQKFPAGIAEGTAPYHMQKPAAGHDNFVLAPPGSVFELGVCPANAKGCQLDYPNPD